MTDLDDRLGGISAAKRALLDKLLRSQPRRGGVLSALIDAGLGMSVEAMLAQALLPEDVDPSRALPPADAEPREILLTGATGFVGAFLLNALLGRTDARIHCLTRAATVEEAHRRIARAQAEYRLPAADPSRIIPLLGDLGQPRLGLPEQDQQRLAQQIDAIHHCGALVKWTYPYSALRAANVAGTVEILRLAATHRRKPVHFISTVGVFSSPDFAADVVLEDTPLERSGTLYVGYAQSKWIAEKLVWHAHRKGLPVSVYRVNTGPADSGAFNSNDHVSRLINACVELGVAPLYDFRVSGAPVDYVARAITEISLKPENSGRAYHLVNPVDLAWNELVAWLRRSGYAIDHIPFDAWRAQLSARSSAAPSSVFASLAPLFTEQIIDKVRLPRFDRRSTSQALRSSGIECPAIDIQRLGQMLEYFVQTGFMDPPPVGLGTALAKEKGAAPG